jgi:lysophospholipid acyltransferase (LPLAT)-like uncharacterized protein
VRGLIKRIGKSAALRALLPWLAAQYIRLVYHSSRWEVQGTQHILPLFEAKRSFILAFWHNRLLLMSHLWLCQAPAKGLPMRVLISGHRDGVLISRTMAHFGIDTITGSKTRGGLGALRSIVRSAAEGVHVSVTPDGPRGPRMRVQPGIISLAALSGAPLVPSTYAVSHRRVLGTWDRFVVALPFSRGIYMWGEPLHVARDADEFALRAARAEFERRMNALVAEADSLMGRAPIEPAPEEALRVGT